MNRDFIMKVMKKGDDVIFRAFNQSDLNDISQIFQSLQESLVNLGNKGKILLDLSSIRLTNTFRSSLASFLQDNRDLIEGTAVEGIEKGVRRIILDTTGYSFYYAVDREDAYEWLSDLDEEEL